MLIKDIRIATGITENSELYNMDTGSRLRSSASTVYACNSWPFSKTSHTIEFTNSEVIWRL